MAPYGAFFNMNFNQNIPLDGQGRPMYGEDPFVVSKTLTINGNNTTVNPAIFTLTGSILLTRLYGIVTTDLSSNHTAAYWRLNDQTAQIALTLATGTTLSAIKAGSLILKKGLVGAALTKVDNVAGAVSEPTTLETRIHSPIILVKKTGALTQIEYVYTTTNAPATGAIQFFAAYLPLSADGLLVAA
jgi:hypothetical protein